MPSIDEYLKTNAGRFEEELCELLRIPSVSADPTHRGDIDHAAQWVAERLGRMGLATEVVPTTGHPLVIAESPPVEGVPTVLVYGHYDVQPAAMADGWTSSPFEPIRRDGNLYARGATDDKGQVLTHVYSAEAWLAAEHRLPVRLKFLIEGEEEVGSDALEAYLPDHAERLACDCVVISDGSMFGPGQPAICYGLRGIAYYDLLLTGPKSDLHSGSFGGAVTNPANALSRMLAALIDEQGRIQVPGFYDDVVPLTPREREQFAALGFDEQRFLAQIGVRGAIGESGYTNLSGVGLGPRWISTGCGAAIRGRGARRSSPPRPGPRSASASSPTRTPRRSPAPLPRCSKASARRASP